ncbi:MAG: F0F1 ATP synthase subunit delta [Anaerolineae bacterium]
MLELDIPTIIFEIVNFLVLSAALYFWVFRRVMRSVNERREQKELAERETQRSLEEAAALKAEWEERMANIDEQIEQIMVKAQEQMEADQHALLRDAQHMAEQILAQAQSEASRVQQLAMQEFQDELVDAVLEVGSRVIGQSAPPELHDTLVQQLNDRLWELGRTDMQMVETIRRSLQERAPTVQATSAHSLTPDQQRLLMRTLSALADHNVTLDLHIDPTLAAGLRIRMGDTIVDNSVATQMSELRQTVSDALKERVLHD